jgi:hypothetical protein
MLTYSIGGASTEDLRQVPVTAEQLHRKALRNQYNAQIMRGAGNQVMGAMNAFTSFQNAAWTQGIARRNAQIAENNARRVEQHTAFVVAAMQKQKQETELKQRRQKMEINSRLIVSNRSVDVRTAKMAQAENFIQLTTIAAENRIRERDFAGKSRAYDYRVSGQNQLIAGQRKAQAHRVRGMQSLSQAVDFGYLAGAKSQLNLGNAALDLMYADPSTPLAPAEPALADFTLTESTSGGMMNLNPQVEGYSRASSLE